MNNHFDPYNVPVSVPAQESVDPESGLLPSEGWHDAVWSDTTPQLSKTGNPMMVITFTIDNGPYAGATAREYIVIGANGNFGEAKLRRIIDADQSGFQWKQLPNLGSFCDQFPKGKFRCSMYLKHNRQIETDNGWVDATEAEFSAHQGRKSLRAQTSGEYRPAGAQATVKVNQDPGTKQKEEKEAANLPF